MRYIFITFAIISSPLYAQFDYNVVLPASPTAAALGSYGDVQVSLYTGTPNISVPLDAIKGTELEIPIGLSYMATGVKVEDNASWVGTGWSLNCTGVITRTIRGVEDGSRPRVAFPLPTGITDLHGVLADVTETIQDPEPDLYHFNFPGHSGSFALDANGEAILGDHEEIRIKHSPNSFSEFTITTANGTQYFFNSPESTTYIGAGTSSSTSGIYLTTIISPTGREVINFNYVQEITKYFSKSRLRQWIRPPNVVFPEPNVPAFGVTTITGLRLASITTNFGQNVSFIPETQARLDLSTNTPSMAPRALKEIRFLDDNENPYRTFTFQYETIETSIPYAQQQAGDPPADPTTQYCNYRLYLKSVQEATEDLGSSNPPYSFAYSGRTAQGKDLLPSKLSNSQDHWGYFNGAANTHLWPGYSGPFGEYDWKRNVNFICSQYVVSAPSFQIAGADREPHDPHMKHGILKSITYPTGGRTEFEFEPHKYMHGGEDGGTVTKPVEVVGQAHVPASGGPLVNTASLVTGPFPFAHFSFELNVDCWDPNTHQPLPCSTQGAQVNMDKYQGSSITLLDSTNTEIVAAKWIPGDGGFWIYRNGVVDTQIGLMMPDASGYITREVDLTLYPAEYTLKAVKDPDSDTEVFGWLYYTSQVPIENESEAPLAGGVRIKKIENFNESNVSVKKKLYSYGIGALLDGPRYATYTFRSQAGTPTWFQPCAIAQGDDPNLYMEVSGGSHTELGYHQGSPVGYSFAIESQPGNGSIEYEYTTAIEYPDNSDNMPFVVSLLFWTGNPLTNEKADFYITGGKHVWPFVKQDDQERKRGFLKSVTYKNEQGDELKKIEHTPVIQDLSIVHGVRVLPLRPEIDWLYSVYKYSTGFVNIASTTEVEFQAGTSAAVAVTTDFHYESPHHKLVTRKESLNSKGQTLRTHYRYPDDYSSITDANHPITKMKKANQHIIGSPVETQVYVNDKIVDWKVSSYANFSKAGGGTFLAPKATYAAKNGISNPSPQWLSDPTQPPAATFVREVDLEFDGSSNLVNALPRNDVKIGLVWDSNYPVPIAKVVNATSSEIAYTSFENGGTGYWQVGNSARNESESHTGRKSYSLSGGAISRSSLNSNQIFKVSFWAKSGTTFVNGIAPVQGSVPPMNGWQYYEKIVSASTSISITGTALIDELRLHPVGAQMNTYVYVPGIGITEEMDANTKVTRYKYDDFGRLSNVSDHQNNLLQQYFYHFRE